MSSVRFFIRNKNTTSETPINLKVYLPNRVEISYSTGLKIAPRNWDAKNQKVRNRVEVDKVKDIINNKLIKTRSFLEDLIVLLKAKGELNKDVVKSELDIFFKKRNRDKVIDTLYEFIDDLIEKSKVRVAKVTWQSYQRTLQLLKDFEKDENFKLSFQTINIDFYYSFIEYLELTNEMSPNTIGKQIKNVKMFMNTANENGISNCSGHKHKHFKVIKQESFQVYLNEEELKSLYELELKLNSIEDRVRDLFLIGAYTGQRISDWKKLVPESIYDVSGVSCFKIKQTKTKNEVVIPLHPIIKEIFKKRKNQAPKFVNEPEINSKIKDIAELAEINVNVREKNNISKFDLISSHTARRSFCTNAYKSGMDSLAIMQLSGHKTEKSFLTYIKISKEEFAIRIANHKFFN